MVSRLKFLFAAALVATIVSVGLGARQIHSAVADSPAFSLVPAQKSVDLSAGSVSFDVEVQGATGVSSFQFELRYDPGVIGAPEVQRGSFLDIPGSSPLCEGPIVDGPHGPGTLLYGCASSVQIGNPGASGTGILATVVFHLEGGASSQVIIDRTRLGNAGGDNLCTNPDGNCDVQGGSITVSGGDPAGNRGISGTPTPAQTPTSTSDNQTPIATTTRTGSTNNDTTVVPPASSGGSSTGVNNPSTGVLNPSIGGDANRRSSVAGAGVAGASTGGRTTGSAARAGQFGYGPQPNENSSWHDKAIAAATLAAIGLIALAAGYRMRRAYRH